MFIHRISCTSAAVEKSGRSSFLAQTALGTVAGRDTKNPTAILKAPSPVEFGMSFTLDGSDSSAVEPRKVEKYIWTMLE